MPGKLTLVLAIGPLAVSELVLYVIVLTPTLETYIWGSVGLDFKLNVNSLSLFLRILCSALITILSKVILFLPVTSVSDIPYSFLLSEGTTGVRL